MAKPNQAAPVKPDDKDLGAAARITSKLLETINDSTSYETWYENEGYRLRRIHDCFRHMVRRYALEGSIYRSKGVLVHPK